MKKILSDWSMLVCLAMSSGCVMRAAEGEFRVSLLQSDHWVQFRDADGTEFASTLDLAAFSKLSADVAKMGYNWDAKGGGTIEVGREVRGLDQTGQIEAVHGIVEVAVKAAVQAALGSLAINRATEVELERIRSTPGVIEGFAPLNAPVLATPTPGPIFPGGTILPGLTR